MCRQDFLDHTLVVPAEDGEQLVIDTFTLPSCLAKGFGSKEKQQSKRTASKTQTHNH